MHKNKHVDCGSDSLCLRSFPVSSVLSCVSMVCRVLSEWKSDFNWMRHDGRQMGLSSSPLNIFKHVFCLHPITCPYIFVVIAVLLGYFYKKKQNVYVPHPTCNRITCVSFSVLQCVLWDGWRWLRRTWLLERAALLLTIASDSCPTARMTSETPWASGERWGVLPQMGQKTSLQFDLKDLEGWSTKDYRVKAEQG